MAIDKKQIGAGGLLVASYLFLGRETISWLWGKALDAIASLFNKVEGSATITPPFHWLDALGLLFGIAGTLVLLSGFRKRSNRQEEPALVQREVPPSKAESISSGNVFYSPTITVSDPPPFEPRGLYVGRVLVWYDSLRDEGRFDIHILGLNAVGRSITFKDVRGLIQCDYRQGSLDALPKPHLTRPEDMDAPIEHLQEIRVALSQPVPAPLARLLADRLEKREDVTLHLADLNINFQAPDGTVMRLPIWNALALLNQSHPAIIAVLNATEGYSQTVGPLAWATGRTRFHIWEGACYIVGIDRKAYEQSSEAQSLASEIIYYARQGMINLAGETNQVRNLRILKGQEVQIDKETYLSAETVTGIKEAGGLSSWFPLIDEINRERRS